MCGIYVSLSAKRRILPSKELKQDLISRGPNIYTTWQNLTAHDDDEGVNDGIDPIRFSIFSTVLSLRGTSKVAQPIRDDESGSFLCWNGEAWKISGVPLEGNDAEVVGSKLFMSTPGFDTIQEDQNDASSSDGLDSVQRKALQIYSQEISMIEGPFAFVFWDHTHKLLLFGRDCLGRRSLLYRESRSQGLVLSSICGSGSPNDWVEVGTTGLYYVNFKHGWPPINESLNCIPWISKPEIKRLPSGIQKIESPFQDINRAVPLTPQQPMTLADKSVAELEEMLKASLRLRVLNVPYHQMILELNPNPIHNPTVAILFSGGLDCSVLARMCHDILPAEECIDLLNVAFENPRVIAASKNPANAHSQSLAAGIGRTGEQAKLYDSCPDRLTAVSSYRELLKSCPTRRFRLVLIDVPYQTYEEHLSKIKYLLQPHNTEMDLSIGAALYFAARGKGQFYETSFQDIESQNHNQWEYPPLVMISGLGADELFAGYSRHAKAFARDGHAGLINELSLDFSRLGQRNLGRDDRVLSHWGRECRYPYLDEDLVRWALDTPVSQKCGFGEESATDESEEGARLEPAKKVLRLLALKFGLPTVAAEKKRAIQFGARTAKMHSGNSKGSDSIPS